jgi:hypothetical protein
MGLGEGIRFVTLDGNKLGAVQEIGLEPVKCWSTYTIHNQFIKENTVIDSIKGFLEVHKQATD